MRNIHICWCVSIVWCEVLLMANIIACTTAKKFIARWVSCFGVPVVITTDRGRQFESNLFYELMKLLKSKRIHTTYESNGLVERSHCNLKSTLWAMQNQSNWLEKLLLVFLVLGTAVKEGIQCSSAKAIWHHDQTFWIIFLSDSTNASGY